MTDKELLKYAAKAAGMYPQDFQLDDDEQIFYEKKRGISLAWGVGWWNPLTDDGAALRLAVKLGLCITVDLDNGAETEAWVYASFDNGVQEDHRDDPYAATRRALVRAAAKIGKETK